MCNSKNFLLNYISIGIPNSRVLNLFFMDNIYWIFNLIFVPNNIGSPRRWIQKELLSLAATIFFIKSILWFASVFLTVILTCASVFLTVVSTCASIFTLKISIWIAIFIDLKEKQQAYNFNEFFCNIFLMKWKLMMVGYDDPVKSDSWFVYCPGAS